MPCVLLIDDDEAFGRAMMRSIQRQGHTALWSKSYAQAKALLSASTTPRIGYALVDDRLPDGSGLDLLDLLEALQPRPLSVLLSAFCTLERALAALRVDRLLLPKPDTPSRMLELLSVLEARQSASSRAIRQLHEGGTHISFGPFTLASQGLRAPTGTIPLHKPSLAILRFLIDRSERFTSAADIARDLLGRRDDAGQALARRQIADTRRALGEYSWLIQTTPKQGYRVAERAFVSPNGSLAEHE